MDEEAVALGGVAFGDRVGVRPPGGPSLARPERGDVLGPAKGLWSASRHALQSDPVAPEVLAVTYLRASYAEMGIHKPKRPMIKSPFV